ncbi:MAG: hypothetical protein MUE40_08890 [Anaerolineae bacterium]|jgi:hypothetical protein|nr:hypothetical protein [Anaerolineae bacterium]
MPDTFAYLVLGLVVVFGIIGGYMGSLYVRFRGAEKDRQLIEQLRD